jgi:putative AdoMet-dependent methyltransferase
MADYSDRQALFDRWAATYSQTVMDDQFPFIGYEQTLDALIQLGDFKAEQSVLDLGVGTGNLLLKLEIAQAQLWGVDFSAAMLEKATEALPGAHLHQADLLAQDWPEAICRPFERIISGYTFHEFRDEGKLAILSRLAANHLTDDGVISIADISFKNQADFDKGHQRFADAWDEEEFYWCAEAMLPKMVALGLSVHYVQTSECAGIYRIQGEE